MTYTLADFNDIRNQGFEYVIPKESHEIIQRLAKTVGDVGYSPTPVFPKKDKPKPIVREPFKATKRPEIKGNDKRIQELTSMLNRMTHDNVSTMTQQVIDKIHDIEEDNKEDMPRVYKVIFDMMMSNKFYIESYVKLFITLRTEWNELEDKMMEEIQKHREALTNLEVCDTTDYDRFCKLKTQHDQERTMTMFIVYMVLNKEMDVSVLSELYHDVDQHIQQGMIKENNKGKLEEWVEHIYIILTLGKSIFTVPRENIQAVAKLTGKDYVGLSSKTIFRYRDILDSIFV